MTTISQQHTTYPENPVEYREYELTARVFLSYSVARRPSHGAIHIGRGGGGNIVIAEEDMAKGKNQARTPTPPQTLTTDSNKLEKTVSSTSAQEGTSEEQLSWAEKGKNLLFGKKQ